jgi:cytochrome c553
MIRDSKGSKDGWFWAELWTGMTFDTAGALQYPNAGFGIYCTRCHASADKELTFSALNNLAGFPGWPLTFRVDDTWRTPPPMLKSPRKKSYHIHAPVEEEPEEVAAPPASEAVSMPAETYDDVVASAHGPEMFLTSNQCQGCHSAATYPFGPTMFHPTSPLTASPVTGINFSEYTEWRWSPMGLAGRDPIFYAQLESELAFVDTQKPESKRLENRRAVLNTCFRCHGVMGKRQMDIDHPGRDYTPDIPMITSGPDAKYGALSRDGVSCQACHHMAETKTPAGIPPLTYFLEHSITGLFETGKHDELAGPFKDNEIAVLPMKNSLGITPKNDEYIKSSRMCGSCHTINLPIMDGSGHSIEQATYIEWLNSVYQNEFGKPDAKAQSCQQCHMPGKYVNPQAKIKVDPIKTRIAIVEDDSYPAADHRAPTPDIHVRFRTADFARHELLGMNAFVLEMFKQFNQLLGVRLGDYMTGNSDSLQVVQDNLLRQATSASATVSVDRKVDGNDRKIDGNALVATVHVENLAGHRFPSGVGFRRLFIELDVKNGSDVVWSSGQTNSDGVIIDRRTGKPLPTEFFVGGKYQKHHQVIDAEDQVQIYEELTLDANNQFTTSFIRRDHELKDNRLLPLGWKPDGPQPGVMPKFFQDATHPKGDAEHDPDFTDGKGGDTLTYRIQLPAGVDPSKVTIDATLWSQTIPPYYLRDRFTGANGDGTKRLKFITSTINLTATKLQNWKVFVASASK